MFLLVVAEALVLAIAAVSKAEEGPRGVIEPKNATAPITIDLQQGKDPLLYAAISVAVVLFAVIICATIALYVRRKLRLGRTYRVKNPTIVELSDADVFAVGSIHLRLNQLNSSLDALRADLALSFRDDRPTVSKELPIGRKPPETEFRLKETSL